MKKPSMLFAVVALLFFSCNRKVVGEGTLLLENGKKEKVEVPFTCIGCTENIPTIEELDELVAKITEKVKGRTEIPRSFIPTSLKMSVWSIDTLISYYTNEPLPSLKQVDYTMTYITQNVYGTELDVEIKGFIHLSDDKERNLYGEAKLPDLSYVIRELDMINRDLVVFDKDDFMKISCSGGSTVMFLMVESGLPDIDKDSKLVIGLDGGCSTIVLEKPSPSETNNGVAVFILTEEQRKKLGQCSLYYISISTKNNKLFCRVPENNADYFQQLVKLMNGREKGG